MTHLFTNRIMKVSKAARVALSLALITLTLCLLASDSPAAVDVGGQDLNGAWIITLAADPGAGAAPPQQTSGILSRDGTVFIQNTVPDTLGPANTHVIQGVGEWVRTGNREFALTWTYLIVSTVDGTYLGMFQDKATLHYNADLTELSGDFSSEATFFGSVVFSTKGKITATRIRVVPL